MGRSHQRAGQAALNADALLKAQQLQGDLALIVIHGHNAVELAQVKGAVEQSIRRDGAHTGNALLGHFRNGGGDDVNLFPAAGAVFAGVGVQSRHGNAGLLIPGSAHGVPQQADGVLYLVLGQVLADLRQRDMAGGAGGKHILHVVDLAAGAVIVQHLAHIGHLAGVIIALIGLDGRFVEGSKQHGAHDALLPQTDTQVHLVGRGLAGNGADLAHLKIGGVQILHVVKQRSAAKFQIFKALDKLIVKIRCAHPGQSPVKHPLITADNGVAVLGHKAAHRALGHLLRADACAVAQQNSDCLFHVVLLFLFSLLIQFRPPGASGIRCPPS